MSKESKPTLNDVLIALETMRKERRKDKLFSKIDSLFFVLITLATFFSGITVTWHSTLVESKLMPLFIAIPITLFATFLIGFKGMIKDDIDTRILSWSVLLVMFILLVAYFLFSRIWGLLRSEEALDPTVELVIGIVPMVIGAVSMGIGLWSARSFIGWIENRLSSLLNEGVVVSTRVRDRCAYIVLGLWGISLSVGIILSVLGESL